MARDAHGGGVGIACRVAVDTRVDADGLCGLYVLRMGELGERESRAHTVALCGLDALSLGDAGEVVERAEGDFGNHDV